MFRSTRDPTARAATATRRQLLGGLLVAGVGAAIGSPRWDTPDNACALDTYVGELRDIRDGLRRRLRQWIAGNRLARDDGFIYSVDAAQMMVCMARAGDAAGYQALREHCVANLIQDDPADAFTRGFVPWRWKQGVKPDASGTTEALRVARGLWMGARMFARPQDAEKARLVIAGYARHAGVDQGIWIIRNYFSFWNRGFATNSFLVDYDPDFVREVADASHDGALTDLADQCLQVVRRSTTRCGLLYDLVQPELRTLYPLLDVYAFSPNDVVGIANCVTTVMGIARGAPGIARGILSFAMARLPQLARYYYGRTGERVDDTPAAVFEYSALARLAGLLGDASAAARIVRIALPQWQWLLEPQAPASVFLFTELLQSIDVLLPEHGNAGPGSANTKPIQNPDQ